MFRLRKSVYLDNNATTRVSNPVREKMNYVLKHCYGNPSSLYKTARNSAIILEESREQVAATIQSQPREIFFTGSATEANNSILKSISEYSYPKKKKIISTPIEHASVISTLEFLQTRGIKVEYCPVDEKGKVNIDALEQMIDPSTFLICCMLANNETGTIQDLPKISDIARSHGVLIMSDCVQALGKIEVDVHKLGLDYASFSAHKIHGPKGVGALFVKEGRHFSPLIHGGHQEQGLRAGTESLHNIAGFAAACKDVDKMLQLSKKILDLKKKFIEALKELRPDFIFNSMEGDACLPNTVNITFPGVSNALFMAFLDYNGISVSAGSACDTQEDTPSHVLKAIGLSDEEARQTIRFSLSSETTPKNMKYAIKVIEECFSEEAPPINVVTPAQLDENIFMDEQNYILDVRFWYDRKFLNSLPNSHEATFYKFHRYVSQIPRNKNILLICQAGYYSPIIAYYLKSKHFKSVGFLLGGLLAWRLTHPDLYKKMAGQNVKKLMPGDKK
ncbi:MAG: aminotransferase class V-fold PLP-dependent enzyme [Candidatus Aminicenantes bacterium]|nr:MAG: aminotransferase class V-fold PLP-dependent enzyme [Candidatus Aminicenantes bacterium]